MAYTVTHGPPALDATHQWAPAAGSAPPVLNDAGTSTLTLPRIELDDIQNWRGRPETVDNRAARTYGVGEVVYPARTLGKTIVYEGKVQGGQDREAFLAHQNAMVVGFANTDTGTMTVSPWPVPGGVVWTFTARVLDLQFDPGWVLDGERPITYEWGFALTLRMGDPLFYTGGGGHP